MSNWKWNKRLLKVKETKPGYNDIKLKDVLFAQGRLNLILLLIIYFMLKWDVEIKFYWLNQIFLSII